MAWEDPEDDDETGSGAVASALANPRGTFSDETGAAPATTPTIQEGAPSEQGEASPDEADAESIAAGTPAATANPPAAEPADTENEDTLYSDPNGGMPPSGMPSGEEDAPAGSSAGVTNGLKAPTLPGLPQYQDPTSKEQELEQSIANFKPENYKPSLLRRIGAGLATAAAGFGHMPGAAQVGEDAINAPLNRAQAAENQKEAGIRQSISDINTGNQRAQTQYNNQVGQYGMEERDLRNQGYVQDQAARAANQTAQATVRNNAITQFQPADPSNPWAGGTGTTADGRKVPNTPPPTAWLKDWSATPQGKSALQSMTITQRQQAAKQMGLNPEQTKYFTANGKIADPTPHTSISILENPDGSARTPGGPKNADDNVSAIVGDATQKKQEFADKWTRLDANAAKGLAGVAKEGDYTDDSGNVLTAQQFQAKIDGFRTGANTKLAKYGASIDGQGDVQRSGAAAAGAPQAQQSAAGPIKAGEKTATGPGGVKVVLRNNAWVDPKTGKPWSK